MKTAEDIVQSKGTDIFSVPLNSTLHDAISIMMEKRIGAVLVQDRGKMVGIWTERDLLRSSFADDFNPRTELIAQHMTKNLITVPHTETIYRMMDKFLGLHLRHLPVEKDGQIIGLLSSGDVIREALIEKTREFNDLNEMLGWEYYENWRWKK